MRTTKIKVIKTGYHNLANQDLSISEFEFPAIIDNLGAYVHSADLLLMGFDFGCRYKKYWYFSDFEIVG